MRTQTNTARSARRAEAFYSASSAHITIRDINGHEIASFRTPRKFGSSAATRDCGKALVSGELVLIAGDHIHVGHARVVS
jgi:hypothetical protein